MWKKIEKAMTLCLAAFLVIVASVSGTMAYASMADADFAIQEDHRIVVQLIRQRVDGNGSYVDISEDSCLYPLADRYAENIIRIKNSGNIDTFNRVLIAVPADSENMLELMPGDGWEQTQILKNQPCRDETCNIYIFTMTGKLTSESISSPAVFARISADDAEADFAEENVTYFAEAQAVQAYGFASAEEAFTAVSPSPNPWQTNKIGKEAAAFVSEETHPTA